MTRSVVIHALRSIPWHEPFVTKLVLGLEALGVAWVLTSRQERVDERPAVLLGTSMWRSVENTGRYLLVDRCSFGDTDKYVSLVWDGHGRRGNHKVPELWSFSRWAQHGVALQPWREGNQTILCGQAESYSPKWRRLADWYATHPEATHFRPHPADRTRMVELPIVHGWGRARRAITLNSSVAVLALIEGVQAEVDDEGGMAFEWSTRGDTIDDARLQTMRWLAWTQWHHDEIAAGHPIAHLFD